MNSRKRESGMSLVEVLAALAIVGIMIMASSVATVTAHKMTRINNDKEFATQKAISILEEMKSLIQTNANGNVVTLDTFDDGAINNPILTIQGTHLQTGDLTTPTQPADPVSGNIGTGPTTWMYERHITVTQPPGQPNANSVRLVDVQIYKNTGSGKILLAEVSSVIRTIVTSMPPSQVYDVYVVAVENVPGWWVYVSNVVQVVKNAITNLESRNPGLVFRQRWVTALAYGRDQMYRPYINDANPSDQNINYAYFYPGKMPTVGGSYAAGDIGNNYYYFPSFFKAHVLVDSTDTNGYDATNNPVPYALADQFNHAMRYQDELNLYKARLKANPNEQMTLRLLLDDMYANPNKYTNALVINLHGELMPFPPIRNYSDAAKDPEQTAAPDLRNIRVVTHPEQLRYVNTDAVKLRVYSYLTNPDAAGALNNMPVGTPITLVISGSNNWAPAAGDIQVITGGLTNAGGSVAYAKAAAGVCGVTPPAAGVQCYSYTTGYGTSGQDTVVKLWNSPLRSPFDTGTGAGLDYQNRLYNMEYIPSPVEDLTTGAVPFTTDLASTVPLPKNTARWILKIPDSAIADNLTMTVETRIGDHKDATGVFDSGVLYPAPNHPENLSRTYVYRGDDNYIFGNLGATPPTPPNLPITERYQFMGDPRHCPYADLKRPYTGTTATAANESLLGMGYNRNFDNFEDSKYNGSTYAQVIGSVVGAAAPTYNFTVTAGTNDSLSVKSFDSTNGAKTTTVTLQSGTRSLATIITFLNANTTFNKYLVADAVNGHLRIMPIKNSNTAVATVQVDTAVSTCEAVFGFDNIVRTAKAWVGWSYTNAAATQRYGVKNDGSLANAGAAGWNSTDGDHDEDTARLFQITRSSIIRSNALWTTMTGYSYYYIGLGGEIGYDSANGFQNSIPVSLMPFDGSSGSWQWVDSITRAKSQGNFYVMAGGGPALGWWSMPWLGELYPDVAYDIAGGVTDWKDGGNLAADKTTASGWYNRQIRSSFPQFPGTDLEVSVKRTSTPGCTSMFWAGNSGSTFHHTYGSSPDIGSIQTGGTDIANHYSFPVPDTMDSNRPFTTTENSTGDNPEFFLQNAYVQAGASNGSNQTASNSAKLLNSYYLHNTSKQSSALLTLSDPTTFDTAFIVVNGLSPTGVSGTTFISNWSFLSLIQSYFNGGLYSDASAKPTAHHIRQLPRVAITQPNQNTNLKDPTSVTITWSANWHRWDDIPYTTAYPAGYAESGVTMTYQVMYSPTNGVPDKSKGANDTGWYFINDNKSATPGTLTTDTTEQFTTTSASWNTSDTTMFPEANYIIRVEAYRNGYPLHYSFHQFRAFINRG